MTTAAATDLSADTLYEVSDHIATITLNRPDKMNTLGGAMLELLSGYILAAERDPDVRVIILTGNGRAFCAGLDLASAAEDPELPGPLTPHARRRPGYARDSALT